MFNVDLFNRLNVKVYSKESGDLFSIEHGNSNLFDFRRVFFIKGIAGSRRGEHAHRKCLQWLSVLTGKVNITLKDGSTITRVSLYEFGELLIIPAGIWLEIDFLESSLVAVGADMTYEETDYLRDWIEFMDYKAKQ